jgi:hypothetical protein
MLQHPGWPLLFALLFFKQALKSLANQHGHLPGFEQPDKAADQFAVLGVGPERDDLGNVAGLHHTNNVIQL